MREKIYTVYAPADNITFIMRDKFLFNLPDPDYTEVIGFYYGTPDNELNDECKGKLKAEF